MLSGFDLYPRWVPLQYPSFTHLQVMFKNDYEDFIVLVKYNWIQR